MENERRGAVFLWTLEVTARLVHEMSEDSWHGCSGH